MSSDAPSRNSNLLLWLLGLFAVGGATMFAIPRAADPPPKPSAEPGKDAKPADPPPAGGYKPLQVLIDHFSMEPPAPAPARPRVALTLESDGASFTAALGGKGPARADKGGLVEALTSGPPDHRYEYEFLIATVPDPVASRFAHEFDAAVDGIQRAYEARGFLLRAAQLPWPRPVGRGGDAKETRAAPDHPGVLLFRQARDPERKDEPVVYRYALVCLVGETPTSGLNQRALTEALQAQKDLAAGIAEAHDKNKPHDIVWADSKWWEPPCEIRIVAPFFSGSQTSLVRTLHRWKEKNGVEFRIVNGSATALRPIAFEQWGFARPESTVIPSELLVRGVLRYLAGSRDTDLDGGTVKPIADRVAFLREANTGFGALSGTSQQEHGPLLTQESLDLSFPISISQLPALLDASGKPAVALPHTEFVEPRMPARDQTRFDTVPPYDQESAASTAGQSLRTIMTTIDRARVRYVGIVASDTRDVVFLNRLLHKECPRARVFTTEPGVALLHPDEADRLRGVLVASTYPLYPAAQSWGRTPLTPRRMIPFPTQGSQGYYNAVLAQAGRHDLMLGYLPPAIPGAAGRPDRPPIWISVIGQGGRLVPVHCYTEYKENEEGESQVRATVLRARVTSEVEVALPKTRDPWARRAGGPLHPEDPPRVGVSVGTLLGSLLAVAAMGVVALALAVPGAWRKAASGITAPERAVYGLRDTAWVWVWRGVMLCGVLLFALPFALPVREGGASCVQVKKLEWGNPELWRQWWRHWVVFVFAWVLVLEFLFAALAFAVLSCRRLWRREAEDGDGSNSVHELLLAAGALARRWWGRRRAANANLGRLVRAEAALARLWWGRARQTQGDRWTDALAYFALAAVVVVACLGTWEWWEDVTPVERFFLYVRATDPTAGMSPLVPMCLLGAAVVVLGWCCLRQADLARRTRLRCPYPAVWSRLTAADRELNEELDNHLRFLARRRHLSVTLGLGVPFLLSLFWNAVVVPLPSEEGAAWDVVMRVVFWVAAAAVVLALARFLALWTRLARLLEEILRVPMVGAFERLPHEIGRLFGGYLYSQRPRHRQLAAVAWALPPDHRERLAARISGECPGLAWVFGTPAAPAPAAEAEAERRDQEDRKWLADRLQEKAEEFLAELPREWRARGVDEAFGADRQSGGNAGPGGAAPGPAPNPKEEFVAAFVVVYLGSYFAQLRTLAYAIACAAPLLLFATASYPFQPDRPRLTALLGLLVAVTVGTVYVLYKINKDGLISRVTRTPPNRFTPDSGFMSSVATYVLPLATLALLEVLGVVRFIIEPVLGLFD